MVWTQDVADSLGVAEDAFRLIAGMIFVYPVMLVHNLFLKRHSATVQHLYFIITGMLLAYWTLGADSVLHGTICIVVTYVVLLVFGGSIYTAGALFAFQLIYLSVGYISRSSNEYVVNWTMPHCVLCLRLIGVAMDVYDGSRPEADLSKDQQLTKLAAVPSLLEMTSHVFYLGSYFVGPQHSMTKFRTFIQRNIDDGDMTGSIGFGCRRLLLGWVYIGLHLVGSILVPDSYVLSDEFKTLPLWKMYLLMSIWVKGMLSKYIGAWLFSEGACIFSGLAYNGRKEDGTILWNGGANVKLRKWEYCYNFGQVIESFNINTNAWAMNYVYKRCRFLNSKLYSQVVTLVFLAVWHGFHSGYYVTFFCEVLVMQFEKQCFPLFARNPTFARLQETSLAVRVMLKVIGKVYVIIFIAHCFMPFALLKSAIYWPLMKATCFPVFLFFGTWPLWKIPLVKLLKPPRTKTTTTEAIDQTASVATNKAQEQENSSKKSQ